MPVWTYAEVSPERARARVLCGATCCVYCGENIEAVSEFAEHIDVANDPDISRRRRLRICRVCGWWTVTAEGWQDYCKVSRQVLSGAASCLRNVDLLDDATPLDEIRSYLTAKWSARFDVSPKRFEEVVASVYRAFGYRSRVVGRSGDGGIDVVLDGPNDQTVAVQVKRYRNSIAVDQIREFTGALVLAGITRGVFVTTSGFQSGATRVTRMAAARGWAIELLDSDRFFDALKIAQRTSPPSVEDLQQILEQAQLETWQTLWATYEPGDRALVTLDTYACDDFEDYMAVAEAGSETSNFKDELRSCGSLRDVPVGARVWIARRDSQNRVCAATIGPEYHRDEPMVWISSEAVADNPRTVAELRGGE
jgi:restriction system protein